MRAEVRSTASQLWWAGRWAAAALLAIVLQDPDAELPQRPTRAYPATEDHHPLSDTRRLIAPDPNLYAQWSECHREWGPGLHEDGFGIDVGDDVDDPEGFRRWVERLRHDRRTTYRWVMVGETVVGGVALRTGPPEAVDRVGHIGFGTRPTARQRGIASWALAQILEVAAGKGLDSVVLLCASDNVASIRTITGRGGALLGEETTSLGPALRYAVSTAPSP